MDDMAAQNDTAVQFGDNGDAVENQVPTGENIYTDEGTGDQTEPTTDQQEGDQAADQGTAEDWDGSKFAYKFRGRQFIPKSKEELINHAQLGYNYQQRAEKLEKQEAEFKQQQEKLDQVAKLAEAFESNPQFKQGVFDLYTKISQGDQAGAAQEATELQQETNNPQLQAALQKIAEFENKFGKLESTLSAQEQEKADAEVQSEIESIKEQHPGHEWDLQDADTGKTLMQELLEHAAKENFSSLRAAYRDFMYEHDLSNAKAEALKQAQKSQQEQQEQSVVGKGGSGTQTQTPESFNSSGKSYDQIAAMAAQAANI